MPEPINLIYLDAYHLDDPLYLSSLARMMGRLKGAVPPCLMVHGSGERAERLLEAEGFFPEKKNGRIQPQSPQEAALIEKALRQVNRQVVSTLTEEIIHAVGFQGTDRGLLRMEADGTMRTGRIGWLIDLAQKGAVPVLSTMVAHPETGVPCEADLAQTALTVAQAIVPEEARLVFFTRTDQPGILAEEDVLEEASLEAVSASILTDPEALRSTVEAGFSVFLTSARGLFGSEKSQGTNILRPKHA